MCIGTGLEISGLLDAYVVGSRCGMCLHRWCCWTQILKSVELLDVDV